MIRALTITTGVLAAAYGGYWFFAANTASNAADAIIADLRADGWEVDYSDLGTRGFPSRIDTTVTDLRLADPDRGLVWDAPFLQVFALSYRPNEIIAAWPPVQTLTIGGQVFTLNADGLMASARVGLASDLPLDSATLQSGLLTLSSDQGWRAGATHLLTAFRRAADADPNAETPGAAAYDLYAELTEIALPRAFLEQVDRAGILPSAISVLRLDARIALDESLARSSDPGLVAITLRDLKLDWGIVSIAVTGTLTPDATGRAEGQLQVDLRNWPLMLEMAVNAGLIPPDQAGLWQNGLLAAAAGDLSLSAPVTFSGGQMSIGPLPLGPAPRLPLTD